MAETVIYVVLGSIFQYSVLVLIKINIFPSLPRYFLQLVMRKYKQRERERERVFACSSGI